MYKQATLWKHYIDVPNMLGGMPVNGDPRKDADCAIAVSFGRNTIPDNELSGLRHEYDAECSGSDIQFMERLDKADFNAGKPNIAIANTAAYSLNICGIPII